jgi:hypothetical protein
MATISIACPNCSTTYELEHDTLFCGVFTCHCGEEGTGTMFLTEKVARHYREHEGKKTLEMMRNVLPPADFAQYEIDAARQYLPGMQIPQHMTVGTAATLLKDLGVKMTAFKVDAKTLTAKVHHFVPDDPNPAPPSAPSFVTSGNIADFDRLVKEHGLPSICEALLFSSNLHDDSFSLEVEIIENKNMNKSTSSSSTSSSSNSSNSFSSTNNEKESFSPSITTPITDDGTKAARVRLRNQIVREERVPSTSNMSSNAAYRIGDTNGIVYNGWLICQESKCPICDSPTLQKLENTLGHAAPEMVFTGNRLVLYHIETKHIWSFSAKNALLECRSSTNLQVSTAEEWSKGSLSPSGSIASTITTTTTTTKQDYQGRVIPIQRMTHDWTYTSEYKGNHSILENLRKNEDTVKEEEKQEEKEEERKQETNKESENNDMKIPYDHLSKKEDIVYNTAVPLYLTELDDNGLCEFTIRLRLMPTCKIINRKKSMRRREKNSLYLLF